MPIVKLKPEDHARIASLYVSEGKSTTEISRLFGVSPDAISASISRQGIEKRPRGTSREVQDRIVELYTSERKSIAGISEITSIPRSTVQAVLYRNKVEMRSIGGNHPAETKETAVKEDISSGQANTDTQTTLRPAQRTMSQQERTSALDTAIELSKALLDTIDAIVDMNTFAMRGAINEGQRTRDTSHTQLVAKLMSLSSQLRLSSEVITQQHDKLVEEAQKLKRK